jgi:hypothetical protein
MENFIQAFLASLGINMGLVPAILIVMWVYDKIHYVDE